MPHDTVTCLNMVAVQESLRLNWISRSTLLFCPLYVGRGLQEWSKRPRMKEGSQTTERIRTNIPADRLIYFTTNKVKPLDNTDRRWQTAIRQSSTALKSCRAKSTFSWWAVSVFYFLFFVIIRLKKLNPSSHLLKEWWMQALLLSGR